MKGELEKVDSALANTQNLSYTVKSKTDAMKASIEKIQATTKNQQKQLQNKLKVLNTENDFQNASEVLRKDKKTSQTYDYFTLAYYTLINITVIFLLHQQYKFSALNLVAVFLVILIVIFILGWFGIPYSPV
jgi:predicted RND superfamily exporter protein